MPTIRALLPTDERKGFSCGDIELDRFLAQYAGQNQFKHYLGVTYVALDGGRIVGYATVAPGSLEFERLTLKDRKGLPAYPLPILRLARLAVDADFKGQGIGPALLKYVLQIALRMGEEVGCHGVLVDAYQTAVSFYERFGFIPVIALEGESATRPETSQMFLALRTIKAATKPATKAAPKRK